MRIRMATHDENKPQCLSRLQSPIWLLIAVEDDSNVDRDECKRVELALCSRL